MDAAAARAVAKQWLDEAEGVVEPNEEDVLKAARLEGTVRVVPRAELLELPTDFLHPPLGGMGEKREIGVGFGGLDERRLSAKLWHCNLSAGGLGVMLGVKGILLDFRKRVHMPQELGIWGRSSIG